MTATIVTSRVAENGRKEPESRGRPRSNCDAKSDDRREKADDDEHGHAVALRRIERVDKMELQIECGGQEGRELSGQRWTVAAEAQGVDCKRDEDGKDGPEADCDGQKCARPGEVELRELAYVDIMRMQMNDIPRVARSYPRDPSRGTRSCHTQQLPHLEPGRGSGSGGGRTHRTSWPFQDPGARAVDTKLCGCGCGDLVSPVSR